ncbi:MAG TPA: PadR family transcriptional regulator, partial [Amycolatopsis sp.]|nr:PadR family transcriptional regulator [Amycolatopsis sp.]
ISLMTTLPRQRVITLLKHRLLHLEAEDRRAKMMLDDLKMSVELGTPEHVGELFRLWGAITSASLGWIKNLIARLEAGEYVMADDAGSAFGAPPAGIPQ